MAIHSSVDNAELRMIESASTAVTASLAATAAEQLAHNASADLNPRMRNALTRMYGVVSTLAQLASTDEGFGLFRDREYGDISTAPLLPYQLVAELAPRDETMSQADDSGAFRDWLHQLADDLTSLLNGRSTTEVAKRVERTLNQLSLSADDSAHLPNDDPSVPGFNTSSLFVFA